LQKGPIVNTGDVPLFPAARLRVQPVFDLVPGRARNLGIWPRWQVLKDGQPDWFPKFAAVTNSLEQRQFGQVDWLKLNESQPMLVPADVRFRIEFSCPTTTNGCLAIAKRSFSFAKARSGLWRAEV